MVRQSEVIHPLRRRPAPILFAVGAVLIITATACASGPAHSATPDLESSILNAGTSDEAPTAATVIPGLEIEVEIPETVDAVDVPAFDTDAFAGIKPGGPRDVDPRRFRQLLGRDRIVPIYEPLVVAPDDANITPEELVMGVAINGEARAYPIGMMRSREIANDELGGVPILVTW